MSKEYDVAVVGAVGIEIGQLAAHPPQRVAKDRGRFPRLGATQTDAHLL